MNNERSITWEVTLIGLALVLGLFLRLFHLGTAPLNEVEAGWSMQALQIAHPGSTGQTGALGSQPAYIFLTGLTFALFGATEFAARLWPALAGTALVFLPLLFRRRIGRAAALVLAFGLALDPGLVTVSRQAGGPMLAMACILLAAGLWQSRLGDGRRPLWAGILGGLALLSGPAALFGLLALSLGWAVWSLFARRSTARTPDPDEIQPVETAGSYNDEPVEPEDALSLLEASLADQFPAPEVHSLDEASGGAYPAPTAAHPSSDLRTALLAGLATFFLVGTAFLTHPQGLAAAFGALPDFLLGWTRPANILPNQIAVLLLVYQPLALIFAIVALARWVEAWFLQNSEAGEPAATLQLWVFFVVALLLALIFPGRQPGDLAWALVPLWGAAAIGLAAYLPTGRINPVSGLQAGLTLTLAALLWVWLSSSEVLVPANAEIWWALRPAIVIGILALSALTTALIALGWRWEYAREGLVWGLTTAFIIYATSALWGAAYIRPNQPQELWSQPPAPGQERLMKTTLDEISNWSRGLAGQIEVVSLVDTPTIRWALRNYAQARFANSLPTGQQPALVITRQQDQLPSLSAAYRGQDFTWWVRPGWEGSLPPSPILWLAYRQAPLMNEYIILWARNDLFPSSEAQKNP